MPTGRTRKRSRWRIVLLTLIGILVGGCVALWRALQYEPEFYRAASDMAQYRQEAVAEQLEQSVQTLQQAVHHERRWEESFSDEELNAWLATELPHRHGRLLPTGISAPRLAITTQQVQLAARWESGGLTTVVSLEGEVLRGTGSNEVEIRVHRMRAGALPVPWERWMAAAKRAAERSKLPVSIDTSGQTPVIRLTIPAESNAWPDRRVTLDHLELSAGRITIGGRSEPR